MRIVVTGAGGLVGSALARRPGVIGLSRSDLDIREPRGLGAHAPDVVINCAAQANVDMAEADPDRAFDINARGAGALARACAEVRARMIHLSTDYVFDGTATRPYREHDPIAPISAYGRSKAEGERLVREAGGTIVRTSWVFGPGGRGFVQQVIARLAAGEPVNATSAQQGCPTFVEDLVDALLALARLPILPPILHVVGEPATTRLDQARAIAELVGASPERIFDAPVPAGSAPRPAFCVLGTTALRALGITPRPWRDGLATMVG
jgi:dTDP-4-dehydrorhamnose reductase